LDALAPEIVPLGQRQSFFDFLDLLLHEPFVGFLYAVVDGLVVAQCRKVEHTLHELLVLKVA